MGVPRLAIKKALNYRRGTTDRHCSGCDHWVAGNAVVQGLEVSASLEKARCRVIGLSPGRAYRILPDNICDRFDQTKRLQRLRGY